MSLMKKRILTEKQKAAARANGGRSRGISTAEGLARVRDANLRHGQYSQSEEIVLTALGETREDFEAVRRGVRQEFPLALKSHPDLVESLAVAVWRLRRLERRQEEVEMQQALEIYNRQTWSISPVSAMMSMSAEVNAQREVVRLTELLREAEDAAR
jgi:hypothetical protein